VNEDGPVYNRPRLGVSQFEEVSFMGEQFLADIPGRHIKLFRVPKAAVIGTDEQWPLFKAEEDMEIVAVNVIPDTAITGVDTNNFTAKIMNVGTAGTGTTEVATGPEMLAGVDWVARVPVALTVSTTKANRWLAKGEVLAYKFDAKGTGLADPVKAVEIILKYRKEN